MSNHTVFDNRQISYINVSYTRSNITKWKTVQNEKYNIYDKTTHIKQLNQRIVNASR